MFLRSIVMTTLLLTAATAAFVPGATAWTCRAGANGAATTIETDGAGTYYEIHYGNAGGLVVELWKETNGESGLQHSPGMSCIGVADLKVASRCLGFCPIIM